MIKGIHFVRTKRPDKSTRWYVYAWRGGPLIMRADGPLKPQLDRAALKALSEAGEDARTVQPDMLAGMVRSWRGNSADLTTASPEWRALAPTTRDTWGLSLNIIEERFGALPIAVFDDPRMVAKIVEWRDSRAATPRAADMGVTVLSQLLEWGRLRAKVRINVCDGIPQIYQGQSRADIIWTDEDMERFALAAITLNRPHVMDGMYLASLTGMRRTDLVDLHWNEVGDHAIVRTAQKKSRGRRRRAVIPILLEAEGLLAELRTRTRRPGVNTVLVTSTGRPWGSPASFTQAFGEVRDLAGIVEPGVARLGTVDRAKHLHDLRGTFVTRLCRAGLTDQEIGNIVAWAPENVAQIRRTYVDDAAIVVALSERIRRAV